MKILVIDVGGTNVKVLATGRRKRVKIPSGPTLTPRDMVRAVKDATADWAYDVVSIGYPAPVVRGKPAREPFNLGRGWVGFDFRRAFGCPVRIVNDAAMQALGSYAGRNMLFLGLGTGLGAAVIRDGVLAPLELAHLPYTEHETYEDVVGERGLERLGKRKWRAQVLEVVSLFMEAMQTDYVVLGGGNARHMTHPPNHVRIGTNANAFRGGFRLWDDEAGTKSRRR